MLEFLIVIGMAAIFLLFAGIAAPKIVKRDMDVSKASMAHYRSRSIGKNRMLSGITNASIRRALREDGINTKYLKQLKQANWYWEPGEPVKPSPKAPFWNVETMWAEKIVGAVIISALAIVVFSVMSVLISFVARIPLTAPILISIVFGGVMGFFAFRTPDSSLASAAIKRQRELALEMGYRIPELRADVLAGNTIQRAIRSLSTRPGGPYVEELRRAVTILDITKDDTLAMDQLIDRNEENELLVEFANAIKMVSRQGGQISPVLNVLADQAQQQLKLHIQGQARRNLQDMTRPIGLSSLIITSLLIIVPALAGVLASMNGLTGMR